MLFSGEYWAGEKPAISLGLADAIGDLRSTLRARYGEKVTDAGDRARRLDCLSGLMGRKSAGAASDRPPWRAFRRCRMSLISALETRAIWAKFGF